MAANPSDVIVAPETRDLEVFAQQLTGWVQERMPGATDLRITDLDYPRGAGQSHETILFDLAWTQDGHWHEQGYVVRIKPTRVTQFPDDLFTEQYLLMKTLNEQGNVPVAKPMWFEEDPALFGAPFFLMEKVRGRVTVSVPPYRELGWFAEATPAQRHTAWSNAVHALAATQKTPLSSLGFLEGMKGVQTGLEQEWAKYVDFAEWVQRDQRRAPLQEKIDQLRAGWPTNQPAGLVWGDARIGNMMFDDDFAVVAVMDWEQPSLGGALNDLAWFTVLGETMHGPTADLPRLEGMGSSEETVALWGELTGISTAEIEWYQDFVNLKVGCLGLRMGELKGWPSQDDATLRQRLKL
jgi:aminoglycoside phosphotransferase (APT) family kinase protein